MNWVNLFCWCPLIPIFYIPCETMVKGKERSVIENLLIGIQREMGSSWWRSGCEGKAL
jgi:hypothetical protein